MKKIFKFAALIAAVAAAAASCQTSIDPVTVDKPSESRGITVNARINDIKADTKVTLERVSTAAFCPMWQPGDKMMAIVGDANDYFKSDQEFYAAELTNTCQQNSYMGSFQGTFHDMPDDYRGAHRLGGFFPAEGFAGINYDYDPDTDMYKWYWRIGIPATQYAEVSNLDPKSYLLVSNPVDVDFSSQDVTLDDLEFYRPMCALYFLIDGVGEGETVRKITFVTPGTALSGILIISDEGEVYRVSGDENFPYSAYVTVDYGKTPWVIGSKQVVDGQEVDNLAMMSVAPATIKAGDEIRMYLTTNRYRYELISYFSRDLVLESGTLRGIHWNLKESHRHPLIQPQGIEWATSSYSNITEFTATLGSSVEMPHVIGAQTAVIYESSDPSVASINADGVITMNSVGITTIKAKAIADETATEAWSEATAEFTLTVTSGSSVNVYWQQAPQEGIHLCIGDGIYRPYEYFYSPVAAWDVAYRFSQEGIVVAEGQGIKAVSPGEVDVTVYSTVDPTCQRTFHLVVDYLRVSDSIGGYYLHLSGRSSAQSPYIEGTIVSNQESKFGPSTPTPIMFHNYERYGGDINMDVIVNLGDGTYVIPTDIYDYAFMGCDRLTSLRTRFTRVIGKNAFRDCTNLVNIDLGENMEQIGEAAFYGCRNLGFTTDRCYAFKFRDDILYQVPTGASVRNQDITVKWVAEKYGANYDAPSTVTIDPEADAIDAYAICNLSNVDNIIIPSSVKSIGHHNFNDIDKLEAITVSWTHPVFVQVDANAFSTYFQRNGIGRHAPYLKVPAASIEAYRAHSFWGGHEAEGNIIITGASNGNITDIDNGTGYNW